MRASATSSPRRISSISPTVSCSSIARSARCDGGGVETLDEPAVVGGLGDGNIEGDEAGEPLLPHRMHGADAVPLGIAP